MKFTEEQQKHITLMNDILQEIANRKLPAYLKGGTALLLCYGLDRFSEDMDLDCSKKINLENTISTVLLKKQYSQYNLYIKKETNTVKRYMLIYDNDKKLKIELSFRDKVNFENTVLKNNIQTYKLPILIDMKMRMIAEYGIYENNINQGRRKARDLHDIIFLAEHYYYEFSEESRKKLVDIANDDDLLYEYITDYSNDSILKNSFFTDIARLKDLTSKCREIDLEKEFPNNPYSQDYCEVPDTDTDSKNTNINKSTRKIR